MAKTYVKSRLSLPSGTRPIEIRADFTFLLIYISQLSKAVGDFVIDKPLKSIVIHQQVL